MTNKPMVVIELNTGNAACELCGKVDELRPYGPKGENICLECGEKNPVATKAAFLAWANPH